jgi:hypothetical protein
MNLKFWMKSATILATIVGFAGCATQENGGAVIPSGGDDCFWANSIHDWKTIDDQTLIVWSPNRKCPYLVELARRCMSIRFTEDLGFYDRDGRICPFGGDAVIVPGPTADRCSIASIKRLSPDDLEILLGDDAVLDKPSSDTGECVPDPDTTE